jgi:hypothetical protein
MQRFSVDQSRSPTFCSTEEFLDGCCKIQEAKHQAITLEDIKEVLTTIKDDGIWALVPRQLPLFARLPVAFVLLPMK